MAAPYPLATLAAAGALAEWLRSGLQSRLHRFDSGRRLRLKQAINGMGKPYSAPFSERLTTAQDR